METRGGGSAYLPECRRNAPGTCPTAVELVDCLSHLGDEPLTEPLDLGHHATLARISEPIGPATGRYPVWEGNRQAARGNVALPEQGCQQGKAESSHCRMALVCLVLEANASLPQQRVVGRDAIVAEPLLPPFVGRIDPFFLRDVLRLEFSADLPLNLEQPIRARHWRKRRFEEPNFIKPFPAAVPGTDRNVRIAAAEVTHLIACCHPHGEVGMCHLECAKAPGEPGIRKSVRRRDREK